LTESLQPEASPGFLLWRATLRWQRQISGALKPLGLTHVQFVLLASTWWLERRTQVTPTQRDLATYAAIDPMMTSQVIRALAARGLVERERDAADARAFRITITDEGADLASRAVRIVEATDAEFFASAPDGQALVVALRALSR
jgi:DNA-binding MarR family transcriptional regulator